MDITTVEINGQWKWIIDNGRYSSSDSYTSPEEAEKAASDYIAAISKPKAVKPTKVTTKEAAKSEPIVVPKPRKSTKSKSKK